MKTKTDQVLIRCSPVFKQLLERRSKELGCSMTFLIVESILSQEIIKMEIQPEAKDLNMHLQRMGNNLNQIARCLNSINREATKKENKNLFQEDPDFRNIAMMLDQYIDEFRKFMLDHVTPEKELLQILRTRDPQPWLFEMLQEDPELLTMIQSREING